MSDKQRNELIQQMKQQQLAMQNQMVQMQKDMDHNFHQAFPDEFSDIDQFQGTNNNSKPIDSLMDHVKSWF